MIYTGLLSLLLAEYAANQQCSVFLLCFADSIYPYTTRYDTTVVLAIVFAVLGHFKNVYDDDDDDTTREAILTCAQKLT